MDNNTQLKLIGYVNKIYNNYSDNLKEAINSNSNLNNNEKRKFLDALDKVDNNNRSLDKNFEEYIENLKKEHRQPIVDSIVALPKEELSNLAESLINITSLKRKVQSDLESVGGPVDVAIISPGDGFIWTKRKRYFAADLNPQYYE